MSDKKENALFCGKTESEIESMRAKHNDLVRSQYVAEKMGFKAWLSANWHEESDDGSVYGYVEIPSNETLSGNAIIME